MEDITAMAVSMRDLLWVCVMVGVVFLTWKLQGRRVNGNGGGDGKNHRVEGTPLTMERHDDICKGRIVTNTDALKDHVSTKVGEVHARIDDLNKTNTNMLLAFNKGK